MRALQNPRVNISGIRRGDRLPDLDMFSPNRLSRQLRRLLDLGAIKHVTGTYRYYLTKAGRAAIAAAQRLTAATIIPVTDMMGFFDAESVKSWVVRDEADHASVGRALECSQPIRAFRGTAP